MENQAKEVLNFQISMIIYFIISAMLYVVLIDIPITIGLGIFNVIITMIATINADDRKSFWHPMNLKLIK